MKVAIIGGGAAGLAAGYHLSRRRISVKIFEAEAILGGLASWFQIGGEHLERYYHFLCLKDDEYLKIVDDLGLRQEVCWRTVRMGYFLNGKRYAFGTPWDLMLFPHLSLMEKIRFAKAVTAIKNAPWEDWKKIASHPVVPWLKETFGENVFRMIHAPLISGKFGEYKNNLSAAWMWARIHRVGKSRAGLFNLEVYGYLQGGSYRLLQRLAQVIREQGGAIQTSCAVASLDVHSEKIKGLTVNGQFEAFDAVISTIPFEFLRRLLSEQKDAYFRKIENAEYYGVTCLILRTRRRLTPHFWLNINDPRIEIPGIIEYTNLNPLPYLKGNHLLYIPQYLDPRDERFALTAEELLAKYLPYIQMINPQFTRNDIVEFHAFKNTHAQPLCDLGFEKRIPSKRTPVRGLYVTDSYQLHPDDRTVSSSLQMGHEAASLLLEDFEVSR